MNKHLVFTIITLGFLLTQSFPPFNLILPFMGFSQITTFVILAVLLFPNLLRKKTIIMLLFFGFVNYFFYLRGNAFYTGINSVIVPIGIMLAGLYMLEYALMYDKNYRYTRMVVTTVIVANVVMAFISIPQLMLNPNIIRGAELNNSTAIHLRATYGWIMSYGTVHGIPLLIAPLTFLCIYLFRHASGYKMWSFVTLSLLFIVYLSNSTTPFILSVIMLLVSILFHVKKFSRKIVVRMLLVATLAFFIFQPSTLVTGIDTVQEVMDERGSNYQKMEELQDELMYGESEGDWEERVDLYETSATLFLESPVFGTSTPELISRHTWIVDRLALFGLLFCIPLFMLFYYYFKQVYSHLNYTKVTFVYGFTALLFMLHMKNEFGQGTWLYGFTYLPLMCRYIDYTINRKLKKGI